MLMLIWLLLLLFQFVSVCRVYMIFRTILDIIFGYFTRWFSEADKIILINTSVVFFTIRVHLLWSLRHLFPPSFFVTSLLHIQFIFVLRSSACGVRSYNYLLTQMLSIYALFIDNDHILIDFNWFIIILNSTICTPETFICKWTDWII